MTDKEKGKESSHNLMVSKCLLACENTLFCCLTAFNAMCNTFSFIYVKVESFCLWVDLIKTFADVLVGSLLNFCMFFFLFSKVAVRVRPLNGAEVEDASCTEIVHVLDENVRVS